MSLAFHPEANLELAKAADWYEDQSFGLGNRFLAATNQADSIIQSDPARFPSVDGAIRVFRMKVYPYKIFYTYDQLSKTVYVFAVSHHRRRPDYWLGRLNRRCLSS